MTDLADEFLTIRDIFRHAVSSFQAAKLVYGHGTNTAFDEAAFIVLEGLNLPIDSLDPWLDARLTRAERQKVLGLVDKRVATRKPAAYLLGKSYIGGVPFKVDERVIVPRSYIGEMLTRGTLGPEGANVVPDPYAITSVLDLCTGSGCLAILAAMAFPAAEVHATDASDAALQVASENIAEHRMDERIKLFIGDLFAGVAGQRYDLIVANPPYVADMEVDAFPPEFAAEPALAHRGGADGFDLVRRIVREAGRHLTPQGGLICEVGIGREILDQEFPNVPFLWLDSETSEAEVFWIGARDLGRV